jgi:3-phenylpropionate/cinnamic acid dioxygenase small subunit
VNRLLTEHAWAEDPPSRTRRVVTNVRVRELGDGEAAVRSYLTLYRSQWDTTDYDLLVGERQDVLHLHDDGWRLRRRVVLLAHTILDTPNLGVFL